MFKESFHRFHRGKNILETKKLNSLGSFQNWSLKHGSSIAFLQKPSIFKSAHKSLRMHAYVIGEKHAFNGI